MNSKYEPMPEVENREVRVLVSPGENNSAAVEMVGKRSFRIHLTGPDGETKTTDASFWTGEGGRQMLDCLVENGGAWAHLYSPCSFDSSQADPEAICLAVGTGDPAGEFFLTDFGVFRQAETMLPGTPLQVVFDTGDTRVERDDWIQRVRAASFDAY